MISTPSRLTTLWPQLAPWPVAQEPALQAMAAYLSDPAVQAQLDGFERNREYPHAVRDRLQALGLSDFFAEPAGGAAPGPDEATTSKVTTVHLCALNQLLASVNTSLAVTIGVNPFALLPVYIAANPAQLEWVFERVRQGAFGAMLLTEKEYGSNLLRNRSQAEPGIIDAQGQFRPWAEIAGLNGKSEPTHYRLSGRKDLINGGSQHELLIVLARTRAQEEIPEAISPLAARSDFSFFVIERDSSITSPQRWHTLPVPAADIASAQFDGTLIPVSQRLGREGSGFTLAQKTLAISRGGVGAFAAGLASRAVTLATRYAQERAIYGSPILQLGAIADHLLRMQALELLVTAMSVKAAATLNYGGFGAAHYGAVAKYACCVLTEALVNEGHYLHGSRALLAEHPYHRLGADAALLTTFDGTTHLVLDQLQWRLEQLAMAGAGEEEDWPVLMSAVYQTPPQSLVEVTRHRSGTLLIPPPAYLRQLAAIPGELPVQPLLVLTEALLDLARHCRAENLWAEDQGLRFEAGKLLAYLETLIALAELADPTRRAWLGLPALPAGRRLQPLLTFTYGWFGGQVTAALRSLTARTGQAGGAALDTVEQTLGQLYAEGRTSIRKDLTLLTGGNS